MVSNDEDSSKSQSKTKAQEKINTAGVSNTGRQKNITKANGNESSSKSDTISNVIVGIFVSIMLVTASTTVWLDSQSKTLDVVAAAMSIDTNKNTIKEGDKTIKLEEMVDGKTSKNALTEANQEAKPKQEKLIQEALKTQVGSPMWKVDGKILFEGDALAGVKVWAIVRDAQGNRFAPKVDVTNVNGQFELEPFLRVIGNSNNIEVNEVTVYATRNIEITKDGKKVEVNLKGEELLSLGSTGRTRWVKLTPEALVAIPAIFFTSLMLALYRFPANPLGNKLQYFLSSGLAAIFVVTMVSYISYGLYMVSVSASHGDALSLGFATIFQGSYVKDVGVEWLFSLTAPAALNESIVSGLGAPLWVLLLSVLGSGVLTFSLLIKHIGKKLNFHDSVKIRESVQEIVTYQFYVLFSPLGAVIVYQLLVLAGAASQPVTVGIAAIAAGVSLNPILRKAINRVNVLLSKDV